MNKFHPERTCTTENSRKTWIYKDSKERALAIKAAILGFDLVEFDTWLMGFEECVAKEELIARRQVAIKARTVDELRAHLELMTLRRYQCLREDYVVPLANVGKKIQDGRVKSAANTKEKRQLKADILYKKILDLITKMQAEFEAKDETLTNKHIKKRFKELTKSDITDHLIRKAKASAKN